MLIVLDPTTNPKMLELQKAFINAGGECYIGKAAWDHLAEVAGTTMAMFIDIYVHNPLRKLVAEVPNILPPMTVHMDRDKIVLEICDEYIVIDRALKDEISSMPDVLPDDVDQA